MKQAVMTELNKVEIVKAEIPVPLDNEVLIKLEYVGVCGSDLHYFEHGRISNFIVETPFVLGHECAGTVVKVGSEVTHLVEGDRVALEPGKTCGECEHCKSGKYNLCEDVIFFATPPVPGTFQEYVTHEASLCFKLPDNVSTKEGALIEPLAVGFHAAVQGGATVGQTAVVTGAGAIGLVSVMALKAMGVSKVYVVDVVEKRLEKAMEIGATGVINAKNENTVDKIMELTEGKGIDLSIETAGAEVTISQLLHVAKKGSTVVFVGYSAKETVNVPVNLILDKEITIKSVFRYRNIFPLAIESVAAGIVPIQKIVSDTFDFDDIQDGLTKCVNNKEDIVKAVIKM
ncbi:NAD(P)-dependent alcohol dehydrogenase [Plebeiibacterium sediminum]|uniref:NAD(P)-dependent alcohol dehydrogenase n=1 Tax=Plebeiibacterium sediminum TaxID=2992112 RepID=A0AAE3M2J4_9BACT|nr:NAD(P)-dependent alcohol dehydrogenase [Plebeiobacterium sediminum]MCW3785575.1 NAD(P)-dependent alcohol dehydrogenase [Plebeiobacterium sediminum]